MAGIGRQVKIFVLDAEEQWDQRAEGQVDFGFIDHLKGPALLVREPGTWKIILESKIKKDTVYIRKEETRITWLEDVYGNIALDFEREEDCKSAWTFICKMQGKDPSVEVTQEVDESNEIGNEDDGFVSSTSTADLETEKSSDSVNREDDSGEKKIIDNDIVTDSS